MSIKILIKKEGKMSDHNSNITDMKFMTKPKILEEFKSKLYVVNGKASNRIGIAILIKA